MEEEVKKFMGIQFFNGEDIPEKNKFSMIMHFLFFEPKISKFEKNTGYRFHFKKEDLERFYSTFKYIVKCIESIPGFKPEK